MAEVETPEPGPGQVRVSVRAASMNHLDLWARRGLPFEIPMPHIGGSDVAGVVDALGEGVDQMTVGARVMVDPSLNYGWYSKAGRSSKPDAVFGVLGGHPQVD